MRAVRAPAPAISFHDLTLGYDRHPAVHHITGEITHGELLAIVGPNGAGKSTLLRCLAGEIDLSHGDVIRSRGAVIGYVPQDVEPALLGQTFRDAVLTALPKAKWESDSWRVDALLDSLNAPPEMHALPVSALSAGWQRLMLLARVWVTDPDALLLDEPTNYLDLTAIQHLEETLISARSAIVMISHDRRFLENIGRATIWLDRGTTRRLDRGFAEFEAWRDDILTEEQSDRYKLNRTIAREEDWLRYGVSARRKRNQGRSLHGKHPAE